MMPTACNEPSPEMLPSTMQAMRFHAPGDIRYETVPLPQPAEGEVLLRIHRALTCGTDLKCFRRGHPVLLASVPSPFGHEFAGTVAAVGKGVTQWKVGDRVVGVNSAPCGECFYCKKGQPNLCETLELLNGGYAEYIVLPERIARINTHELPPELPFEIAAFTEPLAVAMRGIHGVGVSSGDNVIIVGLGPIGQLMVKVATLAGANVTAVARTPMKLEMAKTFGGAINTLDISEAFDPHEMVARHSPEGRGWDVVIEAVGLPETWEKAVQLARRGGKVHWFAGCAGGSAIALDTKRVHYDEITLYSLFHHTPADVKRAFDALATGAINPRPLLSESLPLGSLEMAFAHMQAGTTLKAVIECI
jgi:L-iditol 2-dehydrogenase